jgi:single-stranded-DNA-specific exonuclease
VREPDLLHKFGGHAMAAGMTIPEQGLAAFARTFDAVVRLHLEPDALRAVIHSDGGIEVNQLTLETARAIIDGGPWGQGFPEPTFDDRFEVLSSRVVGEKHWKLVLRPPATDLVLDAIAFNSVETTPVMPREIRAAYRLDENEWQGRLSLQLRIEYLEGVET